MTIRQTLLLLVPLILASSSPFRKELLHKLDLDFDIVSPDIDESRKAHETPEQLVLRLAQEKDALPWRLPADLAYFKKTTTGKTVLMGRKTYDSIGFPLPKRRNIIVSHNTSFQAKGCEVVSSIDDALALALALAEDDDEVMIMGGASFYEQMLPSIDRLYITQIEGEFEGDTASLFAGLFGYFWLRYVAKNSNP
jgi:dihydrofolate reductase